MIESTADMPRMNKMWQDIFANVLCLLIALGSVAAAAWSVVSGRASEQGVDGLFLVIVCLLFGALFSILPVQFVRSGALAQLLKRTKSQANAPEPPPAAPAEVSEVSEVPQGKN